MWPSWGRRRRSSCLAEFGDRGTARDRRGRRSGGARGDWESPAPRAPRGRLPASLRGKQGLGLAPLPAWTWLRSRARVRGGSFPQGRPRRRASPGARAARAVQPERALGGAASPNASPRLPFRPGTNLVSSRRRHPRGTRSPSGLPQRAAPQLGARRRRRCPATATAALCEPREGCADHGRQGEARESLRAPIPNWSAAPIWPFSSGVTLHEGGFPEASFLKRETYDYHCTCFLGLLRR